MSRATLSVILPNYNHGRYIAEALQAIVDQSLPPLEVIVVDDASTDDSVAVVESFARRHPCVRLLRNESNIGAARSADRALRESTGDFLICPSADDKSMPGLFEKSIDMLVRYPQAGLCAALGILVDPSGHVLGPVHVPETFKEPCYISPAEFFRTWERFGSFFVTQTVVFRRAALIEAGGYHADLACATDGFLNVVIPARHGMCFIPEPLAMWRRLDESHAVRAGKSGGALRMLESLYSHFTGPQFAPLFPEGFLARWKRLCLLGAYHELESLQAPTTEKAQLLAAIPEPRPSDILMRRLLGYRLPTGLMRILTKGYLFSNLPSVERRRILLSKFRSLASGGDRR